MLLFWAPHQFLPRTNLLLAFSTPLPFPASVPSHILCKCGGCSLCSRSARSRRRTRGRRNGRAAPAGWLRFRGRPTRPSHATGPWSCSAVSEGAARMTSLTIRGWCVPPPSPPPHSRLPVSRARFVTGRCAHLSMGCTAWTPDQGLNFTSF